MKKKLITILFCLITVCTSTVFASNPSPSNSGPVSHGSKVAADVTLLASVGPYASVSWSNPSILIFDGSGGNKTKTGNVNVTIENNCKIIVWFTGEPFVYGGYHLTTEWQHPGRDEWHLAGEGFTCEPFEGGLVKGTRSITINFRGTTGAEIYSLPAELYEGTLNCTVFQALSP